ESSTTIITSLISAIKFLLLPLTTLWAIQRLLLDQFITILRGISATTPPNKFLSVDNNYGPIQDELTDAILQINGAIPEDLPDGIYIRNGSNPQFKPRGKYHFFDGDGHIHSVTITTKDGSDKLREAKYTNRYVRTDKYLVEKKTGHSVAYGINDFTNFFKYLDYGYQKLVFGVDHIPDHNSANTSLIYFAGRCLATFEGSLPYSVQLPSLKTIRLEDFNNTYHSGGFTAHPKIDPDTGVMYAFNYDVVKPYLKYSIIEPDGTTRMQTPIDDAPFPTMHHDFLITKNYSIFIFGSVVFSFYGIVKGEPFFRFVSEKNMKIGVLPRDSFTNTPGQIKWFDAQPGMIFHHSNAYEEDDGESIVITTCRYSHLDLDIQLGEPEEVVADNKKADFYEYKLNMKTGMLQEGVIKFVNLSSPSSKSVAVKCEFPNIHSSLVGRKNRYVWAALAREKGEGASPGVVKIDLEKKTFLEYRCGENVFGGEWNFVEKVGAVKEQDGYIMSFTHDVNNGSSYLDIVDAETMKSCTKLRMPRRIPYGFHGLYVTEKEMMSI
ncbi:hypothetical protein AKO1_008050, partial [Acrasis kona]